MSPYGMKRRTPFTKLGPPVTMTSVSPFRKFTSRRRKRRLGNIFRQVYVRATILRTAADQEVVQLFRRGAYPLFRRSAYVLLLTSS